MPLPSGSTANAIDTLDQVYACARLAFHVAGLAQAERDKVAADKADRWTWTGKVTRP